MNRPGSAGPFRAGAARTFLSALALGAGIMFHSNAFSQAIRQSPADWSKTLTAAQKEGRVVLYSGTVPAVLERISVDFKKAHPGIKLESSRLTGNVVVSRADQERSSGSDGADVVISAGSRPWYVERGKQRLLSIPAGPSSNAWPSAYLVEGAAPVLALEPIVLAYNTNFIKQPISGYRDLLRPELKGRIASSDLAGPSVTKWYDWLGEMLGPDFLTKFAAQEPRFFPGATANAQATAAAETWLTAFTNPTTVVPLIEHGAPLRMVVPNPSFGIAYTGAILGWSKRQNAAQVLMDYLMSPRAQSVWSGGGQAASPLPGIAGSLDPASVNVWDASSMSREEEKMLREKWEQTFRKK